MGGIRKDVGKNQARAGPGGRNYWQLKIKKIWIQQTERQINDGNGDFWPALTFGIQSVQSHQEIGSAGIANGLMIGLLENQGNVKLVILRVGAEISRELWRTTQFFGSQSPNSLYLEDGLRGDDLAILHFPEKSLYYKFPLTVGYELAIGGDSNKGSCRNTYSGPGNESTNVCTYKLGPISEFERLRISNAVSTRIKSIPGPPHPRQIPIFCQEILGYRALGAPMPLVTE